MTRLLFGTFLAPNIMPVYEAVAEAVGQRLGLTTELAVADDYEACRTDTYDVCFVCSLPYVTFEREGINPAIPVAAPVLHGDRYGNRPIYYSDVIVHRDSQFECFADLRGRSWAYNEPLSHSGYGITRYHLVEMGETEGFFGDVIESGFHEQSVELVRAGEVDGSAIDSQVLEVMMRDHPSLDDEIRVIESLGPSTIQPMAVSRRIDPDLRTRIIEVVLDLHRDPAARPGLEHGLVDHFVAVGAADYDDIRRMLEACEAAGFTDLR